ncbi:GNAT family N-acetyltransferase [Raoultibacter timonensis]|uniref:GNAT family N-acetyltransferase n=1 Tax=Raoultibacter timonensis TaxID=1907662 RepID=UPI000C837C2F|nr:GNAT family N-acetyltransferase [Raoultibacter timonensis]
MDASIEVGFATLDDLGSWMDLIDLVQWNFPGLETPEKVDGYRMTTIKNIKRGSAVCARDQGAVVGLLLFSTKYNMLCHMAVHPDYRRKGIATRMIELMLEHLDRSKDVVVLTFREEDEKGEAPRALYRNLGFEEGELCVDQDYPEQKFILRAKKNQSEPK